MKLELKHLAPYLPYNIRLQFIIKDEIIKTGVMTRLLNYSHETHPERIAIDNYDSEHIWMFKPILRPLSDLVKQINYGIQTYSFTDLLEISDTDGCIFEFDHGNIKVINFIDSIAKFNSYHYINYLPYVVVEMMIEKHFDVFGLIEQGLAIDINTLD